MRRADRPQFAAADEPTAAMAPGPPDPIAFLQEAVRCDTVNPPGNEAVLARMLCRVLDQAGIKADLRLCRDGQANLVATLQGNRPGRRLVLSGHLDTVPLGESDWTHNPFSATIIDGRMYGRGTADMKGGLLALLFALLAFNTRNQGDFAGEVVFAASFAEETGSHGARQMVDDGHLPPFDAMIVAEPSSNQPINAHKGVLWVQVDATGRTAHSSAPSEGVNVIDLLDRFRGDLGRLPLASDPTGHMTPATMAVTRIGAGKGNNVIPDKGFMVVDFRTLPGQDHGALLGRLNAMARNIADARQGGTLTITPLLDLPAVETAADAAILDAVRQGLAAVGRNGAPPGSANYFTDASVFQEIGQDIVILGPGRADQAHQTDEFIEIAEYLAAIDIYTAAIGAYLNTNDPDNRGTQPAEREKQ